MPHPPSKTPPDRSTIAVYGATGHTGRFVVQELIRRGYAVVALARDAAKLDASGYPPEIRRAAVGLDDPAALDRALAGVGVVVNCAGPFLDTADALVSAALRAGAHYVDVAAEQASVQATFANHDAAAREAGRVVIPAMGFYGALADLLVTRAMGDWPQADAVRVGIALDSWNPTEGTRITGRRNTVRRLVISEGVLAPIADPAPATTWSFAPPFGDQDMIELPFSETILIHRHLAVSTLRGYLNTAPLRDLRDAATPPPVAVDASGRSAQTFLVEVEVRRGEEIRRGSARGQDIYAVTAPLVVEAVERILNDPVAPGGVFAPGEVFDASDFLAALAPDISF